MNTVTDTSASPAKYTALLPNAFRDTAFSVANLADDATPIAFVSFREQPSKPPGNSIVSRQVRSAATDKESANDPHRWRVGQ